MKNAENPRKHADDRDYSPLFIIGLGKQFDFDGNNPEIIEEINYIRSGYSMSKAFDGHEDYRKEVRADYKAVKKAIDKFRASLEQHKSLDLANDMYFGALYSQEPRPLTVFPELTEFEYTRGKPFYLELERFLRVLGAGADKAIEHLSPEKGRPKNYAVESLVRRAADFWIDYLGRKFTIDHHDGTGLTPAFRFVQRLANEIEKIPGKTLVTNMRKEIRNRNQGKIERAEYLARSQE